jgi:hypothetical protein
MKIIPSKRYFVNLLHAMFWFISFNLWTVVLNPGVESVSVFQGFEIEWDSILVINLVFLLYCALPFVWRIRRASRWIKVPFSVLFIIPLGYVLLQLIKPDENKEDVVAFLDYFIKNFMYVIVFHLTIIVAVYFNLKVLIKRYLSQSKFGNYLTYALGLCIATAILNFSLFDYCIDLLFPHFYYISYFRIWELVLIVAGYLIFTSSLFLIWQYAQMLIANRDAARNQLSALKAQINPHFLFNNLNTIYSMAEQKDERTSEVILKLSDFLRYILYDTSAETIPLEKEVEIIRTYVELQKERVTPERTDIQFVAEGNFEQANIAPLLLLPLAENCFKHGVGKDPGTICIKISYDGKELNFSTRNQTAPREKTGNGENGGLGIQNVVKRLDLIYPDRHSLQYREKDGIFTLELEVDLS